MSYLDSLFGLDGSTAIVTGATSGLGAASAVALAQAGARVIVSGRDRERGERVVAQIADSGASAAAELELADVADAAQAVELAERVLERHGPVDILVNAAGVFARGDAVGHDRSRTGRRCRARTSPARFCSASGSAAR